MPAGPGVRVDTALRPGERVPPDYDPMIAKIMTVGADRESAIRRMRRALDEVDVTGLQTTLPFDRALVREPDFVAGESLSIDWVAERWDGAAGRRAVREFAAQTAARIVATGSDPAHAEGESSLRKDDRPTVWQSAGRQAMIDRWPR
jgi:Acetyl/propionyl-CoA carboxylase, alpha subunit